MTTRFTSVLAAAAIAFTAIAAPASASPFAGIAGTIQGSAQVVQESTADNVIQVSRKGGGKGHRGGRHHGGHKWHGHKFHFGHGYRHNYYNHVDYGCWVPKKFWTHHGYVWKRIYVC